MENRPVFTIVVPFYNPGDLIENSIESLNNLLNKNFNVVFVDDGTDVEKDKIYKLIQQKSLFEYKIITQENCGIGVARNTGLQNANGEWLIFLDCDDSISPSTLDDYLTVISRNDQIDFAFSDFSLVSISDIQKHLAQENFSYDIYSRDEIVQSFLRRKNRILTPGTVYRKSFLEKNNLIFKPIRWSEDQLFIWECIFNSAVVAYVKLPLYNYLTNVSTSIMASTKVDVMIESFKYFEEIGKQSPYKSTRKYLFARWLLGTLHTLAVRDDYEGFEKVFIKMSARKFLNKLITFPDFKVKILAFYNFLFRKRAFFKLLRRAK